MNDTSISRKKVITIEYVREKLGERGKKMTDQQVSDLLNMLRLICNKRIDAVVEEKNYYEN